ncbi:MAG TPA: hypothetical protein VFW46_15675 [Stellaceae bacterium]|nr:hypothetical protein [Stellaceae bacterium]
MRPGHWMVRCCRDCPEVAARIWLCDHEPGEPDNPVDQPYLQGQIGLDLSDPAEIWAMLEFCEASPEEQRLLAEPPLSDRVPRHGRRAAFVTAPMAKWKQQRARRITAAEYAHEIAWLRWAGRNATNHPRLHYRQPVNPAALPIPQFARQSP